MNSAFGITAKMEEIIFFPTESFVELTQPLQKKICQFYEEVSK